MGIQGCCRLAALEYYAVIGGLDQFNQPDGQLSSGLTLTIAPFSLLTLLETPEKGEQPPVA